MSTSETMVPPANFLVPDGRGLIAWKAVYDQVTIDRLPGGMRSLKVIVEGAVVFDRILDGDQAAHLANLLVG